MTRIWFSCSAQIQRKNAAPATAVLKTTRIIKTVPSCPISPFIPDLFWKTICPHPGGTPWRPFLTPFLVYAFYICVCGAFCGKPQADKSTDRESCLVEDCDMPALSFHLFCKGVQIADVCARHWWLTAFCVGRFSAPEVIDALGNPYP